MSRFERRLAEAGIALEVRRFPEGTRTAGDAAAAIGCSVGQIVKSLVLTARGRPLVALVSGGNRLDALKLAAIAGAPVIMAGAEAARAATGYAIGGVPPFGYEAELAVYMDRDLEAHQVVWAAAGRPDSVFPIAPARLRELSGAQVVDLKLDG
ncbi:MAG: YbaK/EbsC family protein [Candidatus Dormibacteraceae bacterium]